MVRKGLTVWILGSLTFIAGLHALDGFLWLANQSSSVLLGIYPFTRYIGPVDPIVYLLGSLVAVFTLWGGTTLVGLRNPIETFLGKVLEDGKRENKADVELLETRTSILEMMSETLENNSKLLSGLRDVVFNVRGEVLNLRPLSKSVEDLKDDVEGLKKMTKQLEKEVKKHKLCPACGRQVLPKFRLCPYCGENLLKPTVESGAVILTALPLPKGEERKAET